MAKAPDRINVTKKDRELYEALKEAGVFKNMTRKEQFLLAMATGFKNETKRALDSKDGFFLAKDMGPEDKALIGAVAVFDRGDVSVLSDKKEAYGIAEQYAHAGVKLLLNKIEKSQFGTFPKRFEQEIIEAYDAIYGGN